MLKDRLKKEYIYYIILIIVTLCITFPLIKERMLEGDDGVFQFFRNYSTKLALKDGQLIPMVNPSMMGGLGYAPNIFYGVLTTYIITFFSNFTSTFGLAVNLFVLLTVFLSGLFTYFFVKEITKNPYASILAAIIYMVAPYHLYDIYIRGALGETVSFVFFPLVFHGLYNLIYGNKEKWYLLTIGTAGLLLSHNISAFMTAIFAFIYVILNIKKVWNKPTIKKMTLGIIIAVLIGLPTILPLVEAKKTSDYMVFDQEYMKTTGEKMEERAVDFLRTPYKTSTQITLIYIVITLILLCIYIYQKKKKKNLEQSSFLLLLVLSIILTLHIIPWRYLPSIFASLQFSWRFLGLSSLFLSISLALLYQHLTSKKNWKQISLFIVIGLLSSIPFINLGIKNPGIDNQLIESNRIKKRGEIARSTGTASAEYLPRNAIYNYEYLKKHNQNPTILEGEGNINNIKKEGTHLTFDITVSTSSKIELPYIYYPGYIVKTNEQKITATETKNGLVEIKLEKGNYHIISKYRGSNLMITAYIISFISTLILLFLIIKKKKMLNYHKY